MPPKAKILKELEREQEEIILYKPHPFQKQIIEDKHRFKVVVCGRRFGKTTFAINELLYHSLNTENGIFWYVAPTYRQAKMIAWRMLMDSINNLPPEVVDKRNETELYVQFANGSRLEIKGADNEDSLRGVGLNGIVLDEYAQFKSYVFPTIIRPTLADSRGWAIFVGTPRGFNHFYDLYLQGQKPSREWKSFKFKSSDNPYLDPEEIAAARREAEERGMPEVFAQEWEADFRQFHGLIYKNFDPKIHVILPAELNPGWSYYRAMDFGATNPTVCLFIGVDNDENIIVFDEYFMAGQPIDYHAGMIKAKYPDISFRATFGDPSATQEMLEYARWQLYISPALKVFAQNTDSWVKAGIQKVAEKLRVDPVSKKPKLQIFSTCQNLIREMQTYAWEESRDKILVDRPKKVDDHAVDALRYFVVSYGSPVKSHYKEYRPANKITGY